MTTEHINLARKWRSKTFDELVGQELVVRVLKNSLYKGTIFPVYLLAGQRGCGKTTTARIFACALNCAKLPDFQKQPQSIAIPCLECFSCKAMALGQHPDFIEIDAASHTGVDNVRLIIDSATLLPQMGRKKVYLIDEAHMLSKAAFNAFLKILEEPPHSVVFLLATTEASKILETVRSRCMQLFFPALPRDLLVKHLERICSSESIPYDVEGLDAVVRVSQGSARDAINALERLRLASGQAKKSTAITLLGLVDESAILEFVFVLSCGSVPQTLEKFQEILRQTTSMPLLWQGLVDCLCALLRLSYGVKSSYAHDEEKMLSIISALSSNKIMLLLELLYEHESYFLKTSMQLSLLELVLVKMIDVIAHTPTHEIRKSTVPVSVIPQQKKMMNESIPTAGGMSSPLSVQEVQKHKEPEIHQFSSQPESWQKFVAQLEAMNETVIGSVFKQARFIDKNEEDVITIELARKLSFFKELLEEHKKTWTPILKELFGPRASLIVVLSEVSTPQVVQVKPLQAVQAPQPAQQSPRQHDASRKEFSQNYISQPKPKNPSSLGPQAKALLDMFPGTVTDYKE